MGGVGEGWGDDGVGIGSDQTKQMDARKNIGSVKRQELHSLLETEQFKISLRPPNTVDSLRDASE